MATTNTPTTGSQDPKLTEAEEKRLDYFVDRIFFCLDKLGPALQKHAMYGRSLGTEVQTLNQPDRPKHYIDCDPTDLVSVIIHPGTESAWTSETFVAGYKVWVERSFWVSSSKSLVVVELRFNSPDYGLGGVHKDIAVSKVNPYMLKSFLSQLAPADDREPAVSRMISSLLCLPKRQLTEIHRRENTWNDVCYELHIGLRNRDLGVEAVQRPA